MDEDDPIQGFEEDASIKERKEDDQIRSILADTYTFVRSREINKTIVNFTFDHYIDEAKREILEDRVLRSPSTAIEGIGRRPSKMTTLDKLEQDFNNMLSKIREIAQAKDSKSSS